MTIGAGLCLAGCASSGPQFASGGGGYRHYAVGQPHYTVAPYQINGVWYYPTVDYGYDKTGTASWYGPGFDHRATSDGEIYDMNQLSAAHKTLPLPSVVEVTNLQNGRALRLRVNDRGPFIGERLIDVSRRAAQLLGFERSGTASVRVRILRDESIEVAQAAMQGEVGPIGVAAAAAAAPAPAPAAASQPGRVEYAAMAPSPPPSPRHLQLAAAPQSPPPPPPRPAMPPPPSAPAASPPTVPAAAAIPARSPAPAPPPPRHYWPSLIAPAHAEPMYAAAAARPARKAAAPVATAGAGRIFVQAGAFAVPENAQRVRARIAALGNAEIVPARVNGAAVYRVRLGPVAGEPAARQLLGKVVDRGYPGARLVDE